MLLSTNQYTFNPLSFLFFATGLHIDSMHEPAELSQNKLHKLEFNNRFMRTASLISGWWLCLAPLHEEGALLFGETQPQLALLPLCISAVAYVAPCQSVKVSDCCSNVQ